MAEYTHEIIVKGLATASVTEAIKRANVSDVVFTSAGKSIVINCTATPEHVATVARHCYTFGATGITVVRLE